MNMDVKMEMKMKMKMEMPASQTMPGNELEIVRIPFHSAHSECSYFRNALRPTEFGGSMLCGFSAQRSPVDGDWLFDGDDDDEDDGEGDGESEGALAEARSEDRGNARRLTPSVIDAQTQVTPGATSSARTHVLRG